MKMGKMTEKKEKAAGKTGECSPTATNLTLTGMPSGFEETAAEEQQDEVRKVHGLLTFKLGSNEMNFRADQTTGLPNREEISRTRTSTLYRTVGKKQRSMVAHLTCKDDDPDPRAALCDQLETLTKDMPGADKKPIRLRGRRLTTEPDGSLTVTLNLKERKIEVMINIDLVSYPDYTSRLITLMQKTNACLAINKTSLTRRS